MIYINCPDADCPTLEYDNGNEIEYIFDINQSGNIIDTDCIFSQTTLQNTKLY